MSKLLKYTGAALAIAAAVHVATVLVLPHALMQLVISMVLHKTSTPANAWLHSPRVTDASRAIVRPAPDLAYSMCVYDLGHGPVHVTAAAWDDYMSVSVYSHNSDNIFVVDDRQSPGGADFTIVYGDDAAPADAKTVVRSPSKTGVVIQRRLAPTQARWEAANAARQHDVCAALN